MEFNSLPEKDCPDEDAFEHIQFLTSQMHASWMQEELPSVICIVIFLISSWALFQSIVHASSAFEYRKSRFHD